MSGIKDSLWLFRRGFGFFYYSEKQLAWERALEQYGYLFNCPRRRDNYAKTLFGKKVRYTEWASLWPFKPIGNFDDYRLVAIGWVIW